MSPNPSRSEVLNYICGVITKSSLKTGQPGFAVPTELLLYELESRLFH